MDNPVDKLIEHGAENLTDAEVLSIIIGSGVKGRSAMQIAEDVLALFGSFKGMANQPLERFLTVKGLGDAKICRIAAVFELARRCVR